MFLYMFIIVFTTIVSYIINFCQGSIIWGFSPWLSFVPIIICVIFEFAIDGLLAFITSRYPKKWFNKDNRIFNVGKFERKLLNLIKVKKWKDKVWELGGLGGFKKDRIYNVNDPNYIERFIVESNCGVVVHYNGVIFGFLVIFLLPYKYLYSITLPVALVNMLLNLMSIAVLRYNVPKLKVALQRAERNQKKNIAKNDANS